MGSNGNDHNCTHCGCENPIWNALKHTFDPTALASQLPKLGPEPDSESVIFTGGVIYPLKDGNMDERVEALGIHGGDVVASGSLGHVQAHMKAKGIAWTTRQLDGKTLLPGLIEPHVHIVQTCAIEGWLDLGAIQDSSNPDDVKGPRDIKQDQRLRPRYDWNWLKEEINKHIPEDTSTWILGRMVDPALMPFTEVKNGLNQLTTFYCDIDETGDNVGNLDNIVSQNPLLMVSASMHTFYLNTAACKAVYNSHNPSSKKLREHYATCQDFIDATRGNLQEEAGMMPAILSIPLKQALDVLNIFNHLKAYFDKASSRGVTLLYDAMMDTFSKIVLGIYDLKHHSNVRIGYAAPYDSIGKKYHPVTKEAARRFYQGGLKLISDGSNQGLTGYQAQPYCCETKPELGNFNFCDPDGTTTPTVIPDAYQTTINTAMKDGWPLMIHANGDRAISFTLSAYEAALKKTSGLEKRHRIEHCSLLTEDHLKDMKRLGISPSFLIGHVGYWGYAFEKAIFEEKATKMLDLCKSALDHGLRISLHSDCSVTPLGPLRSMEQAVTRKMEGMRDAQGHFISDPRQQPILNEAECLTRQQALKAITYDAAWQCHADQWMGSLQDGHFADLVILEQNPLDEKVPATSIRDIKICETWKGGRKVYAHPEK
ncbi:amidohydrolase [Pseudomonas sp. 10S4]|uniref:amidohydrolase n=1 Tax=Pseudomonas sp. 10S4 TaxID=3048583 RepID=UPI002B226A15|nr:MULTISPECIES: amidohydrolase [unclassified Pseudomonas]MEB0227256.1 amidohydrolase [Pseudomonas sp. 5S1]MEB0297048.1 amidohydrolase [Pseudomonas sp. 10S4]